MKWNTGRSSYKALSTFIIQNLPFKINYCAQNLSTHKISQSKAVSNSCSPTPLFELILCLKSIRQWFRLFCRSMNTRLCPEMLSYLPGYASRTAENDFDTKWRSTTNKLPLSLKRHVHSCTVLSSWLEHLKWPCLKRFEDVMRAY